MYRIAICDDDEKIRVILEQYIERFFKDAGVRGQIVSFSSANLLLQNYPDGLDLIFLDIYMDNLDGMTAAKSIRKFDEKVCLIFITTMHQYALEGYSVRAFGFIKKPVSYVAFSHEMSCALSYIKSNREKRKFISLKSGGKIYQVQVSEILYCEINNHNLWVHTNKMTYEYRCQMKEFEKQLSSYGFLRCHASFLVNCDCISQIELEEGRLYLEDGTAIPVSQSRKKDFMTAFSRHMGAYL